MPKLNRPHLRMAVEHDAPIPMRDGTLLRADIYRPSAEGRYPAVVIRNPYSEPVTRSSVPVMPVMEAGLALVVQYCRGRGSSDGEFTPFVDEAADGVDTIAWTAAQPWCTGRVGMTGISYLGTTTLKAAQEAPEPLRAVVGITTPSDFYHGLHYYGGALALGSALHWAALQGLLGALHDAEAGADIGARIGGLFPVLGDPGSAQRQLPLSGLANVTAASPFWQEWLDHPERDHYWRRIALREHHDRFTTPGLHVGGWFDLFLSGVLENYQGLRDHAATDHARRNQRLIIGPWSHSTFTSGTGDLDFGYAASGPAARLEAECYGFLKTFLTDDADGPAEASGPPVRLFVMGDNTWRDEDAWPLARAVDTRYFLRSGGGLSPEPLPSEAEPSRFSFDPRDPVPTHGGPLLLPEGSVNVGPKDQTRVEQRADVLCFTTEVLTADVEVTGPLSVTLHAATSAVDTDFTAKLVDVYPDGRAMSVIDGIVRGRYRDGYGDNPAELLTPGEVYAFTIDLVATSQVFRAGHRIRVEISSSNFPRFDRNPGSGALSATATEADLVVQHQTVFHDAARPSFVTLPIVPR